MDERKPYRKFQRGGGRPGGNFSRGDGGRDERGGFGSKRAMFMKRTRETVMEALRSRDMLLGGVTKSMEDLDKIINLLGERLEDWYGIYFPELKTEDKLLYCQAVLAINREDIKEEDLLPVLGAKRAAEMTAAAKTSLGAKLSPDDLSECHSLARTILSLGKLRSDYDEYQRKLATELCPNLAAVGGADVAAKLVSHVGSLHKLALLPASTIQVLGAEKALFKHLRNKRIDPPKHGIIFQHPRISASPKAVRGKIARALANQLCLAAKADEFTKRDMAMELKTRFDTRYDEIMKEYERSKDKPPQAVQPGASKPQLPQQGASRLPVQQAQAPHKHSSKPPAQHEQG
jgi:nucleolar protein 56